MAQRGIVKGNNQWYLIANYGDVVVRVAPGTSLGETATGELSFEPSCAQLELDLAENGGLTVTAVNDYELESEGGTRCRHERLARQRGALIRLPHNVLQLDNNFHNPTQSDDTVEIRAVRLTKDITGSANGQFHEKPLTDSGDAGLAVRSTPGSTSDFRHRTSAADSPMFVPKLGTVLPRQSPKPDVRAVSNDSPNRRTEPTGRTDTRRQRILSPTLATLIGIVVVGLALLYSELREPSVPAIRLPEPEAARAIERGGLRIEERDSIPPVGQTADATVADSETIGSPPDATVEPGGLPTAERRPTPPVEQNAVATMAEPETIGSQADAAIVAGLVESGATTPSATAPAGEPNGLPTATAERRSIPPIEQATSTTAAATPVATTRPPAANVVVKQDEIDDGAATEEQAGRRDLLAADRALAQGQLMNPPEASAYTLYSRVLAQDPGSAEARTGLQSVRNGLINRALAELASGALDDAGQSLKNAADAGANPLLVADLRGEVDYRQQLINAQAGIFETLYPIDQLIAVSQAPPRTPRNTSTGTDVSVEVQFTVTENGDVRDVAVLDDPPEKFEQAVRRAVRKWRFEPVLFNGRPMPVRSSVRFTFQN